MRKEARQVFHARKVGDTMKFTRKPAPCDSLNVQLEATSRDSGAVVERHQASIET